MPECQNLRLLPGANYSIALGFHVTFLGISARRVHCLSKGMNMKVRKAIIGAALTSTLASLLVVAGAASASALGSYSGVCNTSTNRTVSGYSNSGGASTAETSAPNSSGGDCGDSGVRASYTLYSGSSVYWTAWKYGSNAATTNPGNIIGGAQHKVTAPSWGGLASFST